MKKLLLLLLVATVAALSLQAENYGINIAGVEVSSSNYNNVTGSKITGSVKYDPTNKILTLTNATIKRDDGGDDYGIHNRSVAGLRIKFVGTCTVQCVKANALHLDKSTTIEITSGSTLTASITGGENYGRGVIFVNNNANVEVSGPGTMKVYGRMKSGGNQSSCGISGFEGKGMSSESYLTFGTDANVVISASQHGIYKMRKVLIRDYTDVKIYYTSSFRALYEVGILSYYNNAKCVTPADATLNSSGVFGAGDVYTHFTDNYGVIISSANFPDADFRSFLYGKCHYEGGYREQYLTKSELQNLTSVDVGGFTSIRDLTGINLLTNVTYLFCGGNKLTSLPTLPSGLKTLNCKNNQITSISMSTLPSGLENLIVDGNKLTNLFIQDRSSLKTLSAANMPSLTGFTCIVNKSLTSINASGNTNLPRLTCDHNALTSLDISGCTAMTRLDCYNNQFTSLPSLPSRLTYLYCYNNKLASLPTLPSSLTYLDCKDNQLTSLPTLPANIETVLASNNRLSSISTLYQTKLKNLDVSSNSSLASLQVSGCSALTSLNLSYCSSLKTLSMQSLSSFNFSSFIVPSSATYWDCGFNNLTSLPTLPSGLQTLCCYHNKLTSLPTLPSGLVTLECNDNQFTSLTVTNLKSLKTLRVEDNPKLTSLYCHGNALTTLNLSNNTALTSLNCSSNQLTSLPTLPNSLETIYCGSNKLSGTLSITGRSALKTLDVSNNTALTTLECNNNALTSLNVSGCTALTALKCQVNKLSSLTNLPSSLTTLNFCYNNFSSFLASGLTALTSLQINNNKIKAADMGNLVNSLRTIPAGSTGYLYVIGPNSNSYNIPEGNEITNEQLTAAYNKRWTPWKYESGSWVVIPMPSSVQTGDVNGDEKVDVEDVNAVINIILKQKTAADYKGNPDVNGDNKIDVEDVNAIINIILKV